MTRDPQDDIRKINALKDRVKTAQGAAATAVANYEQAVALEAEAVSLCEDLGIDPSNLKLFEGWLDEETAEIEKMLDEAAELLSKVDGSFGDE